MSNELNDLNYDPDYEKRDRFHDDALNYPPEEFSDDVYEEPDVDPLDGSDDFDKEDEDQ